MKTWLRKLRGIVGIGAVWGFACSVLGLIVGAALSVVGELLLSMAISALGFGIAGFVLGSGFAVVLTIMDGRKTFEDLTTGRAALWGALAGVGSMITVILVGMGLGTYSGALVDFWASISISGAMTAGLAAGTISLARRAPGALESGIVLDESKRLDDSSEN
jgi:hypothetical protein